MSGRRRARRSGDDRGRLRVPHRPGACPTSTPGPRAPAQGLGRRAHRPARAGPNPCRRGDPVSDLLPSPVWPPTPPPKDGRLGTASISPAEPVVAGEFGTWTLTYTAGRFGIDDAGALRLVFHTTSDLGAPQFDDPSAPDYCRITCSSAAPTRIDARYDGELGVRPWKRTIH